MEKRRWYLNTIPNMTRVENLPVLKVGDFFKLDSSFLWKPGDSFPHQFPVGLRSGTVTATFKAMVYDGQDPSKVTPPTNAANRTNYDLVPFSVPKRKRDMESSEAEPSTTPANLPTSSVEQGPLTDVS